MAIRGTYQQGVFCSEIDHPSVYNTVKDMSYFDESFLYCLLKVEKGGQINLDYLSERLSKKKDIYEYVHPIICISYVNNEIGSTENIYEISKIGMGIDMLSASFHKFGGVRGCGFLYVKNGIKLQPLLTGGHQENNLRAGTEPSYLITAMGNRLEEMQKTKALRLKVIGDISWSIKKKLGLIDGNKIIEGIKQNGKYCSPHIISLTIPNIPAQELITLMDLDGVIVSAGSACSSGENVPSRVLKAIGLTDDEARSTIRISFDEFTTEKDVENLINSLVKNVKILKELHVDDEK